MKVNYSLWAFLACLLFSLNSIAQKGSSYSKRSLSTQQLPREQGKISSDLQLVFQLSQNREVQSDQPLQKNYELFMISGKMVRIEATASHRADELVSQLKAIGGSEFSTFKRVVNAWIPIDRIPDLEELNALQYAKVVYKVTPDIGSVDSQADSAMAVAKARRNYCVDGSGINIGILSDTYNALGGAPAGVSSGNLPGTTNPNGYTTPVTVVMDDVSGIDEGRAMSELVHDLAPGAALYFNTANGGEATFANAILNLANTHKCDVIVDDIRYFEEPFYMDGLIAQACDEVVAQGVPYFASAGNYAQSSYEAPFFANGGSAWHDFDPGPGIDTMQSITVNSGSSVNLTLQWDDPWGNITSHNPQSDLDLFIYNSAGTTLLLQSARDNSITLQPSEFIGATTSGGGTVTFNIAIRKWSGPDPSMIKWVIRNASGLVINEFATPTTNGQATGYGHSNSAGANAVGACAWFDSPAYGTNPPLAEPFTSSCGVQIRYDTSGVAISPVTRNKPEFTANDGISNTFFGGGGNMFYGTSAAAPDAAAVAVLMLQADSTLSPAQVRTMLANSAIDMNTAGFDFLTGAGLIQADSAMKQVFAGSCSIDSTSLLSGPFLEVGDTTYSVVLRVYFHSIICTDSIVVNGQKFELTGTTYQDVTLTGLPADGLPVDVFAYLKKTAGCSLTTVGLFNALTPPVLNPVDTLVITEIMYNPPESGTDTLEFIEIYNPMSSSVNLNGYAFTSGISYTFGNTMLPSGGYVVVCKDSMALLHQFGVSGFEWSGSLANTGELIRLEDDLGRTVDSVDYDNSSPWPTLPDGDGPSLVFCNIFLDNSLGANWDYSTQNTGKVINGKMLKGSPKAQDQACGNCPFPDSTYVTVISCNINQAGTSVALFTNSQGCDSIVTTTTLYDPGSLDTLTPVSICAGDSVQIFGNFQKLGGTYYDTLQNRNGCDSVLATILSIKPSYSQNDSLSICQGDSVLLGGAFQTTAGTYTTVFNAANGCDSIVVTRLSINPSYHISTTKNICQGDSVLLGGGYQTTSGNYIDIYTTVYGCDSIVTTTLNVVPQIATFDTVEICQGDSILIGGSYQTSSGVYSQTYTSSGGCDSVVTTTLLINPVYVVNTSLSICQGDSVFLGGQFQIAPGVYTTHLTSSKGCDSTVVTTLNINPVYTQHKSANICQGDSAVIGGVYRDSTGAYIVVYTTVNGCDSIVVTDLTVYPAYHINTTQTICQGDSALLGGSYQTTPGNYVNTYTTVHACDSVITTQLIVVPQIMVSKSISICQGDSAYVDGSYRTSAGIFVQTLTSEGGCDSIVTTTLNVWPSYSQLQNDSICPGDSLFLAGSWQTATGTYVDSLNTINGCDSLIYTTLYIKPSSACDTTVVPTTMTLVSDSGWTLSTVVTTATANKYPWPGVASLPPVVSFTLPALVGQPYPWVHLYTVPGSQVIKAGSGVTYYRHEFELTDNTGLNARFRMFVDDDMEIFINGQWIAREDGMGPENWRTANHDLLFMDDGTVDNGHLGGDPFDYYTSISLDNIFQTGMNEIILAIRNRTSKPDKGGFSFRMDLDKNGTGVIVKTAVIGSGISSDPSGLQVEVYPNPTEGIIKVVPQNLDPHQGLHLMVFDVNGRMVRDVMYHEALNREPLMLDLTDLAKGVYSLRVANEYDFVIKMIILN